MVTVTAPEVLQAFNRPGFYPHAVASIIHLQTHISHVFLTGGLVYKLKKPLDLGFLDFSHLEDRRYYCLEELRLNQRLAPEVYRQVLGVYRSPQGLRLAELERPQGELVEVCLQMRELEQERMMDRLLEQGQVEPGHIQDLARQLVEFYRRADRGPEIDVYGRVAQIRMNLEENFLQTEPHRGLSVSPARWGAVRDYSLGFLDQRQELFRQRVAQGRIVDGHGDLHAGNINIDRQGQAHIFDCIEFNHRFRYQDLACDLAFLAMELDFHGQPELARLLEESLAQGLEDRGLHQVMDFYKCYRAVVRAKVHGFLLADPELPPGERKADLKLARAYFALAARYAGDEPPFFLVCFMGLMGTGKTYLARMLAARTGWDCLHSDAIRKELAGLDSHTRVYDAFGQGLYDKASSQATYQALWERAQAYLAQGQSVIVDASFVRAEWRERFLALARQNGAQMLWLEVTAEQAVVRERLARREAQPGSLSDGRLELTRAQAAQWEDAGPLLAQGVAMRLDGGGRAETIMQAVLARLEAMGRRPAQGREESP